MTELKILSHNLSGHNLEAVTSDIDTVYMPLFWPKIFNFVRKSTKIRREFWFETAKYFRLIEKTFKIFSTSSIYGQFRTKTSKFCLFSDKIEYFWPKKWHINSIYVWSDRFQVKISGRKHLKGLKSHRIELIDLKKDVLSKNRLSLSWLSLSWDIKM